MAPLMAKSGRRGRPREVGFREVINAVRYLVRSGCGGRKRHIAVDTNGRLLMVNLSSADISDSAGAMTFSTRSASTG